MSRVTLGMLKTPGRQNATTSTRSILELRDSIACEESDPMPTDTDSDQLTQVHTDMGAVKQKKASVPSIASVHHPQTSHVTSSAMQRTLKQAQAVMARTVIDPRRSTFMRFWDMAMVVALLFTAIITPVEVSFLDEGRYITFLWITNRCVDLCFLCDIFITFHLAYLDDSDPCSHAHWVFSKRYIASKYIRGWFTIDVVSILPFWVLSLEYADPFNNADVSQESGSQRSALRATVLFRIVKMLRMLKLTRLFKASRVAQRRIVDIVTTEWEWTYAVLRIMKLIIILVSYAHLQACIWGFAGNWARDIVKSDGTSEENWIKDFTASFQERYTRDPAPLDVYVAALYWSYMTLTSIGYGEFTAVTTQERLLGSMLMMTSGMMWTYSIGSVASIATTLYPNAILYETNMDNLNYFMRERRLDPSMRMALRDFFTSARRVHQHNSDNELLDKLSPLLRGTVALAANKRWINNVWYLRGLTHTREGIDFLSGIAKELTVRTFVAHERLPIGQLYILKRGAVVKNWRFLSVGMVWGEDLIIDNMELMDHSQAVALTYVEAQTLRRADVDSLAAMNPEARQHLLRAALRIKLQRALLQVFCGLAGKRTPLSFIPRSASSGVTEITEDTDIPLVKKVDRLLKTVTQPRQASGVLPLISLSANAIPVESGEPCGTSQLEGRLGRMEANVDELKLMVQELLNWKRNEPAWYEQHETTGRQVSLDSSHI